MPQQEHQFASACIFANRLRVQERGKYRLLHLPKSQSWNLCLNLARLGKLTFEDAAPVLLLPLVLLGFRHTRQFACRLGEGASPRRTQEDVRGNQWTGIP